MCRVQIQGWGWGLGAEACLAFVLSLGLTQTKDTKAWDFLGGYPQRAIRQAFIPLTSLVRGTQASQATRPRVSNHLISAGTFSTTTTPSHPSPPRPPSPHLSVLHSGFASLPSLVLRVVLVFVEECRRPGKTRIIKPFCYHAFKCKGPGDSDVINCHGFFKGADSK